MFASKGRRKVAGSKGGLGRVYILEITLEDGDKIYKIGMTHSDRSTDRMMEIMRSWFMAFRYVPHTRCKMDFETGVPLLLEKHIHELLAEWKWVPEKKVDGAQEMFKDIYVQKVIDYIKNFDYSVLLSDSLSSEDSLYIKSKMTPEQLGFDDDVPF